GHLDFGEAAPIGGAGRYRCAGDRRTGSNRLRPGGRSRNHASARTVLSSPKASVWGARLAMLPECMKLAHGDLIPLDRVGLAVERLHVLDETRSEEHTSELQSPYDLV